MPSRVDAVIFDSFGTLFDLDVLRHRLQELRLPSHALELFFAGLLRDAFALEVAGDFAPFKDIAASALEVLCAEQGLTVPERDVTAVIDGLSDLPAYPDVGPAIEYLRTRGLKTAVLSNGSPSVVEKLLERNRLRALIDIVISAESVKHFKPHREPYLAAAKALGVAPGRIGFVAAHAWDVHGAQRAGLVGAWVNRLEKHFQRQMRKPEITAESVEKAAAALAAYGVS